MAETANTLLEEAAQQQDPLILDWMKTQKDPVVAMEELIQDLNISSLEDLKYIILEQLRDKAVNLLEQAEKSDDPLVMLWLKDMEKRGEENTLQLLVKRIREFGIENLDDLIYVLAETTRDNAGRILHQPKEVVIIKKGDREQAA